MMRYADAVRMMEIMATIREIEEAHARGIPIFITHKKGREHTPLTPVEVCING